MSRHRRRQRHHQPDPELVEALVDVAEGHGLLMLEPDPRDAYGTYQWQQALRALTPPPPPKQEIAVTNEPTPQTAMSAAIDELSRDMDSLIESVNEHMELQANKLADFQQTLIELQRRVEALELREPGMPSDKLGDAIVSFLQAHPGLKFNPTSIAENIGADGGKVAEKIRKLARHKLVSVIDREGRNPIYFYEVS